MPAEVLAEEPRGDGGTHDGDGRQVGSEESAAVHWSSAVQVAERAARVPSAASILLSLATTSVHGSPTTMPQLVFPMWGIN